MDFRTLKKNLDSGKLDNMYIFSGEEREVMLKYIHRIAGNNPVNHVSSFASIAKLLTSRGLFGNRGIYIITDDKSVLGMELKDVKRIIGKEVVIFVYGEIDGRLKFFKSAKEHIVAFKRFSPEQLTSYVRQLVDVPLDLAEVIASYCGSQVARIETECDKLNRLEKPITAELISEVITPSAEDKIFEMVDAVVTRRPERAFDLYLDLLELKESPVKLISLLYTKFKQVFLVQSQYTMSSTDLVAKTGLTPFQLNITKGLIGAYDLEKLVTCLRYIQRMEVDVKTGKVDQFTGFENLLVNLFTA